MRVYRHASARRVFDPVRRLGSQNIRRKHARTDPERAEKYWSITMMHMLSKIRLVWQLCEGRADARGESGDSGKIGEIGEIRTPSPGSQGP